MPGTGDIDPNLISYVQPVVTPDGDIVVQPTTTQPTQADSIQSSDEIAEMVYLYSAAMPVLVPPNYENKLSEITSKMLDNWSKQEQELAKRTREWLASPEYHRNMEVRFPAENIAALTENNKIQLNLAHTRNAGVEATAALSGKAETASSSAVAFMAGSLVIGSGMIVEFTPVKDASGALRLAPSIEIAPSIVKEGWPAFQSIVSDPALSTQLGYLAGMIAMGAVQTTVGPALVQAQKEGAVNKKQVAKDFANTILNLVSNKDFDQHILFRIVDRMPGAENLTELQKNQMVAIVKTILLATSLAALYQGETGWLGEETTALLEGKITGFFTGEDAELRTNVAVALHQASQVLSPEQRTRLVEALSKYFKSKPELKQLANIEQTFQAVAYNLTNNEIQA